MNIMPENIATNNDAKPALVMLNKSCSVISSGANNAFKDVIFRALKRLSCISANKDIIAPVHNSPYAKSELNTCVLVCQVSALISIFD